MKELDIESLIDNEDIVNIDTDNIDKLSLSEAESLIDNLRDIYTNPDFMKNNPKFVTRLKAEIEDLRILLKVRKSDETVHDIILGSIGKNPNNASMFRALTDVQKTILSTTTEISTKIKDINAMLKNIQLEIPFEQNNDNESDNGPQGTTFRGTRDFIKQMKNEIEEEKES
jgi:hypothetical protein